MANTKKTKDLLKKKIKELEPEEAEQQNIVNDLEKKLSLAQGYYDAAALKLSEIKDTIKDYKKDKDK